MIRMLNTSPKYFWKALWMFDVPAEFEPFEWSQLFGIWDLNLQCYVLEIIESFLVNDLSVLDQNTEEAKLRKSWLPRFIS